MIKLRTQVTVFEALNFSRTCRPQDVPAPDAPAVGLGARGPPSFRSLPPFISHPAFGSRTH